MASLLTDAGKNVVLEALADVAVWGSLHTADPGTTGDNEVTGGSPAYARKAMTWNAASGGALDNSNAPVWDVPATTVAYVGLWSAESGGTYYGHFDVDNKVFSGQGQYTFSDGDISVS